MVKGVEKLEGFCHIEVRKEKRADYGNGGSAALLSGDRCTGVDELQLNYDVSSGSLASEK